jgi:hypothetical protein
MHMQPLLGFALALLVATSAHGKAEGVDSRAYFPPIGCGSPEGGPDAECHVQNADPTLLVTIDGPTQIGTGPEDVGFYTVSIPPNSGGLMGAGMNVALVKSGTGCELEEFGPSGKIGRQNETLDPNDFVLSHAYTGDPPPSTLIGVWSYQFLVLNCTTPGAVLLRAAMNAFDGSGDELGEIWNETELPVTVPEPSATAAALVAIAALLTRGRSWSVDAGTVLPS